MDLFATEKVSIGDIAHRFNRDATVDHFAEARQSLVFESGLTAEIIQTFHLRPGGCGNRDQDLFGFDPVTVTFDIVNQTKNRNIMNFETDLGRIVIHQADYGIRQERITLDLPDNLLGGVTGPNQQKTFFLFQHLRHFFQKRTGIGNFLVGETDHQAMTADHHKCENRIYHKDRTGVTLEPMRKQDHGNNNERAYQGCFGDIQQIIKTGITPHTAIETEAVKNRYLDKDNQG